MATIYVKKGTLYSGGKEYVQGSVLPMSVCRALDDADQFDDLKDSGTLACAEEETEKIIGRSIEVPKLDPNKMPEGKPPVKSLTPISPWVIDPKTLEGKTLDQLNVMIKEIDPSEETFTDVKEAIAFLSQDHGK